MGAKRLPVRNASFSAEDGPEKPVSRQEFASLMEAFAPFEAAPHIAVAVSGGADSMGLCLLAQDWARDRGGRVTALTVDHGLRAASADEARRVGRWMGRAGVAHQTLVWPGDKPSSGIQAAARRARYKLMNDWCRDAGVLHLLLGHHRRDQAETFLMRLGRGSGPDGLAAMPAIAESGFGRLLRPVLGLAPERLKAVLMERGQDWIEDPSNHDPAYARARIRAALPGLERAGVTVDGLAVASARMGRARTALNRAASTLIAHGAFIHPAGFARVDGRILAAAPAEVSIRALRKLLMAVGGRAYGPGADKLDRLHGTVLKEGLAAARTLSRCRIVPGRTGFQDPRGFLICRERRGLPAPVRVHGGDLRHWDGRFFIAVKGGGRGRGAVLTALGRDGWRDVLKAYPEMGKNRVPEAVRPTLPALFDESGVISVPHIGFVSERSIDVEIGALRFAPPDTVSGLGF